MAVVAEQDIIQADLTITHLEAQVAAVVEDQRTRQERQAQRIQVVAEVVATPHLDLVVLVL